MMSGIRSQNTKPEILTRKALHRLGYRFRLGSKIGKIKPDIVLRKYKIAIFTHGCYWHQHKGCKLAYSDRKYTEKWLTKFRENKERDARVKKQLLELGWRVAIVWECLTRNHVQLENEIQALNAWILDGKNNYFETKYKQD